jgi:hypothetical protein
MNKFLCFCLAVLVVFSCRNRNPNLTEKKLLALMNDTTRKMAETATAVFPDTSYVPPVGAKYAEIRSVDPASPPITLKVSVSEGQKQPLKLSMFDSWVEYVTLRLPNENDFFLSITGITNIYERGASSFRSSTQVKMLGNHFVTSDVLGIRLFDTSGKFVQNLLLSEFEGQRNAKQIEINFDGYKNAILRDLSDTRCFLTYVDYKERKVWAGEFNLANLPLHVPQSEITQPTQGVEMVQVRRAPSGKNIDSNTRFSFWGGGNQLGVSFNNMGDTLCKFANYVRLEEGQKRGPANSDNAFSYRSDGELYFRQAYCDTIFRVQSANRIVPAFRFDFGAQRVTLEEGTNAKTQGKLLPWKLFALKNSMILIFTEGRDCPNCRAAGNVTFHCLLFDKQTGRSTAINMKSQYPENALIENDIDDGLPMPLNSINSEGDVIMATFTKNQIEEILKNNAGNIPAEIVSKLKTQINALEQNEMLVMIVR